MISVNSVDILWTCTLHVIYVVWYVVRCIIHSLYYKIYSLFQNTYPLPQSRECIPSITSRRMYTPYFRTHMYPLPQAGECTHPSSEHIPKCTHRSSEHIPTTPITRMYTLYHKQENVPPYFRTHMYPLSQTGECTRPSSEHTCTPYHKQENVHALFQNTYPNVHPLVQNTYPL